MLFVLKTLLLLQALLLACCSYGQTPVITPTNTPIRIMAANLSSGSNQRYEAAGLRILQGLKPDIVAIQEFNYAGSNGINTPNAFRQMIDLTFGTNFSYFRESSAIETYTIPNGIISRYPILTNATWDDTLIPDRGYAWAKLQIPGTNPLYVVSVHLKASGGSAATRSSQVTNLKALIQTSFPSNAWVVVAGDMNIASGSEAALTTFKTFLSDYPVPTDQVSLNPTNTNASRSERYDYVLPSFSLTNLLTPVLLPSHTYPAGLVFDSAYYNPLSDAAPVLSTDSHVTGMQHMAVIKDFNISYLVTNLVVEPPAITGQPQDQSGSQGTAVPFSVSVTGTEPLHYQWQFQAAAIAGATEAVYTRSNLQAAHQGAYSVTVSNLAGTVVSSNAILRLVVPAPWLRIHPNDSIHWEGLSNLPYRVESAADLHTTNWSTIGTAFSSNTNLIFEFDASPQRRFLRVVYP